MTIDEYIKTNCESHSAPMELTKRPLFPTVEQTQCNKRGQTRVAELEENTQYLKRGRSSLLKSGPHDFRVVGKS